LRLARQCSLRGEGALIVANEFLKAQIEQLQADVSKGYARGYYHGRFKTYTG
jgi:hypothetical protein